MTEDIVHSEKPDASHLLKAVQTIAISPMGAKSLVATYRSKTRRGGSDADYRRRVAEKIVQRYAKLAATSGAATGLTAVVPGVGTAIALVGGALADAGVSIKWQVDMCMCLAEVYDHDVSTESGRHIAFLVSVGAALESAARGSGVAVGSAAGVRLVRQYLKGATLQLMKELFKKFGIVFTRKALEKAIPFGIGVLVGGSTNYILTRYVGGQAIEFFAIDRELPPEPIEV